MTTEISNNEDVIDSRDVIARIEELESERDDFQSENNLPDLDLTEAYSGDEYDKFFEGKSDDEIESLCTKWDEWDNLDEYKKLKTLADQCEGYGDWTYGETLIRDSYFEEYAQELAEDVCEMPRDLKWPYTCIDWEKAARELQYDYSQVSFDGVDYWIRA